MYESNLLHVGDFAKLSQMTRDALIHYEAIGLITPVLRKKNNYRYYSTDQLPLVNMIRTFQDAGMTLEEIKELKDMSIEEREKALYGQMDKIAERIEEWVRTRKLFTTLSKIARSVANVELDTVSVQFLPSEAIVLGNLNDYSGNRGPYDARADFYREMHLKYPDLDTRYPVWGVFSESRIRQGDYILPDRYYFYNPDGYDKRPAALYAVAYARGGYGQTQGIYARLMDYIQRNGYEVCGSAYEEYPLNEIFVGEAADYLIRAMVMIRKKQNHR